MKIKDVPYKIKEILSDKVLNTKTTIIVYKPYSLFHKELIYKNFISLIEDFDNYSFFDNKNLIGKNIDFVLKAIFDLSLEEIKVKKRIKLKDFNLSLYELEILIEELKEVDGYFSGVDIDNELIENALFLHELISFTGRNGMSCIGTEKLENLSIEEIFILLTCHTFKNFEKFNRRYIRLKEKKELYFLANKYGFDLKRENVDWNDYLIG